MRNKCVLDASALLVLINQETGHEKIAEYLSEGCMSTVNLSEVAAVLQTLKMPNKDIQSLLNSLVSNISVFDEQQAFLTAELRAITRDTGLSLGDRACLALGQHKNIPVITADKVWAKLNIPVKVILIR